MSRYYLPRDRERERTPTRFYSSRGDRSDFNRPDVPRGPRQNSDTPTRAPTGPRVGRGNFRDARDGRDATGYVDRGDRWRESEFSQRPRSRTPPRRDSREFPKPIDTTVARRDGARDGPPSAGSGSNVSDAPRNASYRGGFSRGRGDFRGRSYQNEDRNSFRPRSRSRGPRRERDRSVDSRDLDFRDRQRETEERRFYRERDDREGSYFRRDQPSKPDSRQTPFGGPPSAQSTPQTERPPPLQDRPVGDPRREHDLSRRGSTISDGLASKEGRRESERYDLITGRPDPVRPARAASPPPSAPQVPAFGSFRPNFQTTSSSISWVNPNLQKTTPAAPQPFKGPPTAPRALTTGSSTLPTHPPTAPKADRVFEQTRASQNVPDSAPKEVVPAAKLPVSPSQASVKLTGDSQPTTSTPTGPARDMVSTSGAKHLVPPSAPRAMTSPSNFGRAPSPNPPSINPGWGRSSAPHTSPRMLSGNIPTGPKADRMAPQSLRPQPPSRPYRAGSQPFTERPSTVPSKRESNGQERERGPAQEHQSMDFQLLGENATSLAAKLYETDASKAATDDQSNTAQHTRPSNDSMDNRVTRVAKVSEDVDMDESPLESKVDSKSAVVEPIAQGTINDRSDDDDEELDEVYFAQHERDFLNEKARVVARKIDLSAEEFCPSLLLEEAARLAAIRLVIPDLEFKQPAVPEKRSVKQESVIEPAPTGSTLALEERGYDQDMDMDEDDSSRESSLDRMSTPDLETLPYLEKGPPTPLSDPDPFSTLRYENIAEQEIKARLKSSYDDEGTEQQTLRSNYRELYLPWKRWILDMDRAKEDTENAMKQSSPEAIITPVTSETVLPATTPTEGSNRRMHRFASQYELDRIMELSLREEEEKKQREQEAKEAQASASADREARIPDMLPRHEIERRRFEDVSQARQPRDAIRLFEFVPPLDDFTEEEDRILRTEYAQNIKVWGKIAAKLRPRTYKECINHYYATKWDKPYKTSYKGGRKARGTRGRGRGGTRGGRSALVPADADMDIGDGNGSSTPLVTDTGRPRRAAAPVWPKDAEGEQGLALATPGRKPGATRMDGTKDGEAGADKPARRGGKTGKEKGSRKPRNQPIAARPVLSPQKAEKEPVKEKSVPMQTDDWLARAQSAARESDIAMQQIYADNGLPGYKADIQQSGVSAPTERPRSHSQTQRQGASSYWSVVEEHDFKKCLAYFGTDYQAIANHMGTKTQTMIKNHYQKFVNDGKHMDMIHAANEATRRRANGEDMGAPPIPTMASKRRYDTSQPLVPRTLAPSTDELDVEQSPTLQPTISVHSSPAQFAAQTRFPLQQANRPAPASVPGQQQEGRGGPQAAPARTTHGPPHMGYFLDEPRVHPQQPPPIHTMTQTAHLPDDQRKTPIERIKTEYEPNPSRPLFVPPNVDRERERERVQRERDHERERELIIQQQQQQQHLRDSHYAQMRAKEDAEAQKLRERQANPYTRAQQPNPFHGLGSQPPSILHNRHISSEPGRQEPRGPWGTPVGTPASSGRAVVDLTASQASSKYDPLPRSGRPASPAPRMAQTPQPAQQPPRPPQAASEAPKRVNIMSMLNPEPEEERPRKRDTEQGTPASANTPSQQYRGLPNNNPELSTTPREHNEVSQPFSRPSYHSAHQTPTSALSTPISESAPRDPLPSIHRDGWQARQSFQQQAQAQHQAGSPHSQQQQQQPPPPQQQQHAPQMPETRQGMFNYRTAAFGSLNQQPRANPSPPPGGAFPHSRTSSFSHQQHGQLPSGTSAPPGPALNLRNNPYAHKEPTSSHSSHLSGNQITPVSARNDLSQPASQFSMAQIQNQRDARFDRFREREPDAGLRERDQGPGQPPRFDQRTPPGVQHRYAPPERTGHTPLQHLGYAPPEGQPPRLADQRAMEYNQELLRRDQERARQREERLLQEARHAQDIQEQAQRRSQEEDMRRRQLEQQQWRSHADRYGPGR